MPGLWADPGGLWLASPREHSLCNPFLIWAPDICAMNQYPEVLRVFEACVWRVHGLTRAALCCSLLSSGGAAVPGWTGQRRVAVGPGGQASYSSLPCFCCSRRPGPTAMPAVAAPSCPSPACPAGHRSGHLGSSSGRHRRRSCGPGRAGPWRWRRRRLAAGC